MPPWTSPPRPTTRCGRLLELAAREPSLVKVDAIIAEQQLPRKFVEAILGELRRAGLVRSQRGADGGYALALPASEITLGSVIRAVDGPLGRGPRTAAA